MRICLFEDRPAAGLGPVVAARPVADLLCGLGTLGTTLARHFAATAVGHLVRPPLAEVTREGHPGRPVNDPLWLRAAPAVLVNARWLPPAGPGPSARDLVADGPRVEVCDGQVAFAVLDTARLLTVSPAALDDCLADWLRTLPAREAGGHMARTPADLLDHNPARIVRDFEADGERSAAGFRPPTLHLVGPADRLFVHPSAKVDPLVVADTTGGPVVVGPGAKVDAFSRLEGPCGVGPGSRVMAATLRAGTTLGPHCRVGGEVLASILHGHTDKPHDGFLGRSYVGAWVHIGAGTTGQGSAIGDHATTGPNVLLEAGTVVGPFAEVLPTGAFTPRDVPAFARCGPDGLETGRDVGALLAAARGGVTPAVETLYRTMAGCDARPAGEMRPTPGLRIRRAA